MTKAEMGAALGLAALTFAVCYLRGFVLPHSPLLFWGDQPGFATKGARMLAGELPYRDFFEFLTPGTDLVYAGLFRIFGILPWLPNLVMDCLAAYTAWLMTYCAARIVRGPLVALPAILLTGFVLYGSLDATHHWFSTALIMTAVAVLMRSSSQFRITLAAFSIGMATSFTQTKGVATAAGLVIFLVWQSIHEGQSHAQLRRRVWLFLGVSTISFFALNLPFVLAAGPVNWINQVFVFPVLYFGSASANNLQGTWPQFRDSANIVKWLCFPFLYIGVPLIYAAFFLRMRQRLKTDPDESWDRLLLIAIVGVAMLAVMIPALSIRRVSCASPPAMILLAWQLSHLGRLRRAIPIALGAISCLIAVGEIYAVQFHPKPRISLPRGSFVLPDAKNYELYRWSADHTRPGQWFFGFTVLDLPLGVRNPTPLEALGPGEYTRPEQVTAMIAALERARPPLLILPQLVVHPESPGRKTDNLEPFRDYLRQHYHQVKVFYGGFEAWQRVGP
ncbi:MAG TPA: hypothetical protein VKB38_05625 [Terracidiphilus sp.]|nr:hypothetical protein [Terracidiphilus sp.]